MFQYGHVLAPTGYYTKLHSGPRTWKFVKNTGFANCLIASSQQNLYDIHLLLCVQC